MVMNIQRRIRVGDPGAIGIIMRLFVMMMGVVVVIFEAEYLLDIAARHMVNNIYVRLTTDPCRVQQQAQANAKHSPQHTISCRPSRVHE